MKKILLALAFISSANLNAQFSDVFISQTKTTYIEEFKNEIIFSSRTSQIKSIDPTTGNVSTLVNSNLIAGDMAANGDLLYYISDYDFTNPLLTQQELYSYDATTGLAPSLLFTFPFLPTAIEVNGSSLFCLSSYDGLVVELDLSDTSNITMDTLFTYPNLGLDLEFHNNHLYFVMAWNEIGYFDLGSNASTPSVLTSGAWYIQGLTRQGDDLYFVDGSNDAEIIKVDLNGVNPNTVVDTIYQVDPNYPDTPFDLAFLSGDSYVTTNRYSSQVYAVAKKEALLSNIVESQKLGIKLFPNPVCDFLTIESDSEVCDYKIYDSIGKLIIEGEGQTIDLRTFDLGIYYVSVKTKQGRITKKIVKQ